MNTSYTATARKFRPHVRQLVNEEVIPLVHEAEETQVFPVSVWRRLGEEGLLGLGLAKEHGGLGGGRTSEVMVVEELSRAAAGIAMSIMPAYIVRVALWTFGAGELIEEVGESLIRGERIVGIAITEPNAGSDVSSIQTRVERTDGGYLLNGSKIFITNGNLADDLLVVARTGEARGIRDMGLFFVSVKQDGYRSRKLDKECARSSDTAEVWFSDCFVPGHRVVGEPTGGFKNAMHVLNAERLLSIARSLVLAEESTRIATEFCSAGGNTISSPGLAGIEFQRTQADIINWTTKAWLIRLALEEVCRRWDLGEDCVREISMLKAYATEEAARITLAAQQLAGAAGLADHEDLARNGRDARLATVGAGSIQVQNRIVGRMLGFPRATA